MTTRTHTTDHRKRKRGYTLVELMISLSIFAFSSSAIGFLMHLTYNTKAHIQGTTNSTSSSEIVMRRIIEIVRSSTDVLYTDPQTGLFVQTPPDTNDNLSYIYIWYVDNQGQLKEQIKTAQSLTQISDYAIITNLKSFAVTRVNPGQFPESYQVDLVVYGTPVPISRSVVVTARNITQ